MPRLVPKRAPEPAPPDDSSDWPAPARAHPFPHTKIVCIESFNYYRGDTLLRQFVKDELQSPNDPLAIKAWADFPSMFLVEEIA
jgi:hypothetical protein